MRTFTDTKAVRSHVPVLCALYGPSGGGKTFSALRLAEGIKRVVGGEIFVIDTESRRALHYADQFDFRHVEFGAPFGPLDYLAAIEHCVNHGAKTVVVDSMSHEHEGPGGVLEQHDKEMGGNFKKSMIAWAKPKAARRRLINTILQLDVNLILCFRGKDKTKPAPRDSQDKEPVKLGWMPIGGEEYVYDMTMSAYIPAASDGTPDWHPTSEHQKLMLKLPRQFRDILPGKQLSEDIGEQMARWAAGTPAEPPGPYRFPKGEHAGKLISDAPDDYLEKLRGSDAVTGQLRTEVEAELAHRSGEAEPPE